MQQEAVRPLLRWAGSKQRLLPALISRMPKRFNRYFEPFAGSASLYFSAAPKYSTLSDVNADLISFYKFVRDNPALLYKMLSQLPRNSDTFYEIREQFPQTSGAVRAAQFWYLNRHCFNGLYRTNRAGKFNVPYGAKLPPIPALAQVEKCADRLRSAIIREGDFELVLESAGEGDFIYVDPPYRRASSRDRGEYGLGAMADTELDRLIKTVRRAESRGALILISYNVDLSESFQSWSHEAINGRYLISADPSKRRQIEEFTTYNYKLPNA